MSRETPQENSIQSQATAWFTRLRAEDVSQQEVRDFNHWLNSNPQHQTVFQRLDDLWLASKDLQDRPAVRESREEIARLKAQAAEPEEGRASPRAASGKVSGKASGKASARRPHYWRFAALATAASLVVAVAVFWANGYFATPDHTRYITQTGERETITLADGSTLTLNTQSTVDVQYTETVRQLTLHRGQANFTVSKDLHRPFVVTVDQVRVTALGTQFDIHKMEDKTAVTLLAGVVQVDVPPVASVPVSPSDPTQARPEAGGAPRPLPLTGPPPLTHPPLILPQPGESQPSEPRPAAPQSVRLHPGQQVAISRDRGVAVATDIDVERITAWRDGNMIFDDTPLQEAIREANRYTDLQLKLGDPALAGMPISGIFQAGNSAQLAGALENLYGLSLTKIGSRKIIITSR